jgi:energy-coupling factor transporter ATP-binding protein EcfA2
LLNRVHISHFQSLRDVDLELQPVTVVIGESDLGKSALIRALISLFRNRPGSSFITFGERLCVVEGDLEDHVVQWRKGSENAFVLDGVLYDKVGQGVPEDLTQLYNLSDASVAEQFDRPYLVFDTGATVSGVLGDLTNISLLYDAVRAANQDKQVIQKQLSNADAERDSISADVTRYAQVLENVRPLIESIRTLDAKVSATQEKRGTIEILLHQQSALAEKLVVYAGVAEVISMDLVGRMSALDNHLSERHALVQLVDKQSAIAKQLVVFDGAGAVSAMGLPHQVGMLNALVPEYWALGRLLDERSALENSLKDLPKKVPGEKTLKRLDACVTEYDQMITLVESRVGVVEQIAELKSTVVTAEYDLAQVTAELQELVDTAEVCPLSGGVLFKECRLLLGKV